MTARTAIDIEAAPADVFAVLLDPQAFIQWVIGARRLRGVDSHWPQPGARFHHEVGVWPFVLRDWTRMVEVVAPARVVLEARVGPVGVAKVTILVEARAGGSQVTMLEEPLRGALRVLPRTLFDPMVGFRNRYSLLRLRGLVESRAAGVDPSGVGV